MSEIFSFPPEELSKEGNQEKEIDPFSLAYEKAIKDLAARIPNEADAVGVSKRLVKKHLWLAEIAQKNFDKEEITKENKYGLILEAILTDPQFIKPLFNDSLLITPSAHTDNIVNHIDAFGYLMPSKNSKDRSHIMLGLDFTISGDSKVLLRKLKKASMFLVDPASHIAKYYNNHEDAPDEINSVSGVYGLPRAVVRVPTSVLNNDILSAWVNSDYEKLINSEIGLYLFFSIEVQLKRFESLISSKLQKEKNLGLQPNNRVDQFSRTLAYVMAAQSRLTSIGSRSGMYERINDKKMKPYKFFKHLVSVISNPEIDSK